MEPYGASWTASSHHGTACADCHIPSGTWPYIQTKLFSLREIYVHVTGQVEPPLPVTREIPDENCTSCHPSPGSVKLASSNFDHTQHAAEPCVSCHRRLVHGSVTPPMYVDPAAMSACMKCHDGKQASAECATCHQAKHDDMGACELCHTQASWEPQVKDHPFPLTGKHKDLACATCHKGGTRPSAKNGCAGCHKPPHAALGACDRCHTTTSWTPDKFKHPVALTGGHADLACARCHPKDAKNGAIAGTSLGRPAGTRCVSCHGDQHNGLKDCSRCHSTKGWSPARFQHPGAGEHSPLSMQCSLCHPKGYGSATCTCHNNGTPMGD